MSGDHNMHQKDQCAHLWRYSGSKRQQAWQCAHCQAWRFSEPVTNEFNPDWFASELSRAYELLARCENEMRYAGWTKFESDNPARNGVYEQVKQFLEKA